VLILFGNGVVANVVLKNTKGNNSGWIVITAGWAFAVMVAVFVAQKFGSPGAHLNPAVTIAVAEVSEMPMYILAQMIGAILGSTLVWLLYLPHWGLSDKDSILAAHATGPAIRDTKSNLLSEIIGTAFFIVAISSLGITDEKGMSPYLVGMVVWGVGLSLGGPTGYAINPARDLGPRIAHAILPIAGKGGSDWNYAWIPVIGPAIGAIIGSLLMNLA
jgi:glycerol uptake facilitator protein